MSFYWNVVEPLGEGKGPLCSLQMPAITHIPTMSGRGNLHFFMEKNFITTWGIKIVENICSWIYAKNK